MRYRLTVRAYEIFDHTFVDVLVMDDSVEPTDDRYQAWVTTLAYDDLVEPNPKRWARQILKRLAHDA